MEAASAEHQAFAEWALSQGIEANGVGQARFRGQGMGIVALRKINAGETIVSVPISAMLTMDKIPLPFRKRFPTGTSVQTLFAAYLCYNDKFREEFALWRSVWPSFEDLEQSLPILWPQYLIERSSETNEPGSPFSLLPPYISGKWNTLKRGAHSTSTAEFKTPLESQQKRLRDAIRAATDIFPDLDEKVYTYYWFISDTRCFHYVPVGGKVPEDRNDAMALCPFADYFNHSDEGCNVSYDEHRYSFTALRSYEPGEEVFVSYGQHTTDTLLLDYGFVPAQNKWDSLSLDDIIVDDLNEEAKEALKFERYLGNYRITTSGPCYRTEVAACITYMPVDDWERHIQGDSSPSFCQTKTNAVIHEWITVYINEADSAIEKISALAQRDEFNGDTRFDVLLTRWRQIHALCQDALNSLDI